MDFKGLENKREEIASLINGISSPRLKLFLLTEFIEIVFQFNDKNILESYLSEFIDEYIHLLKIFEPSGFEPSKTEQLISTLNKIIALNLFNDYRDKFIPIERLLINRIDEIKNSLIGNENNDMQRLYFPAMEYTNGQKGKIGFLDYIDIKVYKKPNFKENTFIIIPSSENLEKRLSDQVKNSWETAVKFVKDKSLKIEGYYEVVININKKYGEYAGNSLGLVLTLGFIEELLSLYQARDKVKIKSGIALTGGVDGKGNVPALPEEIISVKVEVAFYSTVKFLIVPKASEQFALNKLEELHKKYPERNLKIIGIESVFDLLDRRTLIDIDKINIALFLGKKIKRHKYALAAILLLFVTTGYFYFKDYDNNPYSINISNHILYVKNKYGGVLWNTHVHYSEPLVFSSDDVDLFSRIFDINNDGINEVLITNESFDELKNVNEFGRIACFSNKHKLLWKYVFRESIETRVEKFSPFYSLKILAIKSDIKDPEVLLVGQHENFYPSPIIKLCLRDGKRVGGIFWHPGGGSKGFLNDIDGDGKDELVAIAISNGLEHCVLYCIDYDKLKGTAPTTINYRILNQPIADFDHYIILPKSDLNEYYKERYDFPVATPTLTYNNLININIVEEKFPGGNNVSINYDFDKDFKLKCISIGDKFRVVRDSLVAQGKLKEPYTETPQYKKYLREQIKYWNGSKFVSSNDFKFK